MGFAGEDAQRFAAAFVGAFRRRCDRILVDHAHRMVIGVHFCLQRFQLFQRRSDVFLNFRHCLFLLHESNPYSTAFRWKKQPSLSGFGENGCGKRVPNAR